MIIDQFNNFLKENNVYDIYYKYNSAPKDEDCDYLALAFDWASTEEGLAFWCDINNKWIKYLDSINKEISDFRPIFEFWLQINGYYNKFIANKVDKFYNRVKNPECLIESSFCWYDTSEGYSFWKNVNYEFHAFYKRYKNLPITKSTKYKLIAKYRNIDDINLPDSKDYIIKPFKDEVLVFKSIE